MQQTIETKLKIAQGAQAIVYLAQKIKQGQLIKYIIKERPSKKYRHPKLDERINKTRQNAEIKNLKKALKEGLFVPKVLLQINNSIHLEYIQGKTAKQHITNLSNLWQKQDKQQVKQELYAKIKQVLLKIGIQLNRMHHKVFIIHGDLTTSNMIINKSQNQQERIYFLDFGLSSIGKNVEQQAVDLYVLEKAFISTHPQLENQFIQYLLKSYGNQKVLNRLDAVRMRGRKKVAFG